MSGERGLLISSTGARTDYSGECDPLISSRQSLINESVVALADIKPNQTVLDLCTGARGAYHEILKRGASFIGTDIAHNSLSVHRNNGASVVQTDAKILPFSPNSFNHVLMVMALHNVLATKEVVGQVADILVPGGSFTIAENGIAHWISNLILFEDFRELLNQKEIDNALRFFEAQQIDPAGYARLSAESLFGYEYQYFVDIAKRNIDEQKKGKANRYQLVKMMNMLFHMHLDTSLQQSGLKPVRHQVLTTHKRFKESEWEVEESDVLLDLNVAEIMHSIQDGDNGIVPSPKQLKSSSLMYILLSSYTKE